MAETRCLFSVLYERSLMTKDKLKEILDQHKIWLASSGKEGRKANLSRADLRNSDLREADLRSACLSGADFSGNDLHKADLRDTILYDANLRCADLTEAKLQGSDLRGANLRDTKLPPKTFIIIGEKMHVQISNGDHLRAGCQSHSVEQWRKFKHQDLKDMHDEIGPEYYCRMFEFLDFYLGKEV